MIQTELWSISKGLEWKKLFFNKVGAEVEGRLNLEKLSFKKEKREDSKWLNKHVKMNFATNVDKERSKPHG